jgi:hypothetical protein
MPTEAPREKYTGASHGYNSAQGAHNMRWLKLLGLTTLVLLASGAFAASGAYAVESEETGNPRILVQEGKAKELAGTLKAGPSSLVDLTGGQLAVASVEMTLKNENCIPINGSEKETNLCNNVTGAFTGVKKGEVGCRSETSKGEKAPAEMLLLQFDLHVSSELTAAKVLQSLLVMRVLGLVSEEEVKFSCGVSKDGLNGDYACLLLPALVTITMKEKIEVLCKVNETSHDPETGTCQTLCEPFGKIELVEKEGEKSLDMWPRLHLAGELNKAIYIDD